MISLSLLFSSQAQSPTLRSIAGANAVVQREVHTAAAAEEYIRTRGGEDAEDVLLRSGIVSMEHWLDLNA